MVDWEGGWVDGCEGVGRKVGGLVGWLVGGVGSWAGSVPSRHTGPPRLEGAPQVSQDSADPHGPTQDPLPAFSPAGLLGPQTPSPHGAPRSRYYLDAPPPPSKKGMPVSFYGRPEHMMSQVPIAICIEFV